MVCFPNAKINIGLNIISKRSDGFHNLETVFYPIGLCDILEFNTAKSHKTTLKSSGISLDIENKDNICIKAYQLLEKEFKIPALDMYLHKNIPSGAGLGGGSSDAAFLLSYLNSYFKLKISNEKLEKYALQLGSDCAFFIKNKPVFAQNRGETFENISLDLSNYYIYLAKPDIFISTQEAFSKLTPEQPGKSLNELIKLPIEEWKNSIYNDFEKSVFENHPVLAQIKSLLYENGALYASMSGSGSSVYGIFKTLPKRIDAFKTFFNWISPFKME